MLYPGLDPGTEKGYCEEIGKVQIKSVVYSILLYQSNFLVLKNVP